MITMKFSVTLCKQKYLKNKSNLIELFKLSKKFKKKNQFAHPNNRVKLGKR